MVCILVLFFVAVIKYSPQKSQLREEETLQSNPRWQFIMTGTSQRQKLGPVGPGHMHSQDEEKQTTGVMPACFAATFLHAHTAQAPA